MLITVNIILYTLSVRRADSETDKSTLKFCSTMPLCRLSVDCFSTSNELVLNSSRASLYVDGSLGLFSPMSCYNTVNTSELA
ncbi:hypothetical protein CI610_02948 [invertebrate metagenome]|uniref:Uncharacterized protein n=1 Tax=invertebrate metagenome TaxID=1711999 RepID=A0A2H9T4I9_9ZZZZ